MRPFITESADRNFRPALLLAIILQRKTAKTRVKSRAYATAATENRSPKSRRRTTFYQDWMGWDTK